MGKNTPPNYNSFAIRDLRLGRNRSFNRFQALEVVDLGNMVKVLHVTTESTMSFILQPWQLYFVILAGWINRQQQEVIKYLRTENQVLKEKLGKKRILLNEKIGAYCILCHRWVTTRPEVAGIASYSR